MSRWTYIFLLSALFLAAFAAAPPKVYPKPWKLCGDEKCSEILFTTKVERTLTGTHELFLNGLVEGQEVHVVAIKFSNRPDIMEAMTADGQRGIIMDATVNKSPYAEFLRTAIEAQKSLKIISQDKNDIGEKRVFGALEAHQDLVRDYNVVARRVAAELGQPAPTELPVPEPPSAKGHGHSHGGHGHSHGAHGHAHDGGHGHSHETGHAHSHDPPANQQAVPTPAPAAPVASANAVPPVAKALPTTEGSGAAQQQPPVDATAPVASNIAPEATQPVVLLDNTVENANVPVDAVPVPVEKVPVQPPTPPTAVPLPDDVANNADGTTNGVGEPVLDVEAEIERLLNRDLELMQKRKDAANAAKAAATVAEQPVQPAPVVNAAEPNLAAAEPALAQHKVADPVVMPHLSLNMLGKRFAENSQEAPNAEVPSGDAVPASPTPVVSNENAAPEVADSAPEVTLPPLTLSSSKIPPSDPVPATPLPVSDSVPTTPSPVQPFENAPHLEATNIPPVVEPVVTTPSPVPTEIPTFTDAVPDIPVTTTPHPVHVRGERDSLPATDIPENFCYGDDCKNVKPLEGQIEEAVPSTTAAPMIPDDPVQPQEPAPNPVEENKDAEIPSLHKTAGNFGDVETMARIQPPTATGPSLMGRTVRAICDGVRSSVPGTGDLSDGGVGIVLNVTVLLIAATMYLVGSMLSDGDTELFERKAAHDLATRYKALQGQLKERNEQLSRMQHLGGQAQQAHALLQENEQLRHDIGNMRIMYGELEAKYTSEGADKQSLETDLARLREELSASRDHEAELERRFAAVRAAHDDTQAQVAEAREQMKEMELRLKEAVRQKETLNGEVNKAQSKVVEFEVDMRQLKVENQTLNAQRDDLEVRNVQLEEMFANTQQKLNEVLAAKKEEKPTATDAATGGSAGGSNGGSNGWSDLEEFDEHDHSSSQTQQSSHARKVSPVSAAAPAALAVSEIQEVARLRGEIKRLELRVESAKNELDKELVIKESLEGKIHMLEEEVRDKSRRVEESDSENRRTNQRCDKLLQLVEEANAKLRETETTCNKLRDEMRRMQDEARQLEDDRRKKEERLKETENDLKKLRNDHLKLETKQFNLIREHKAMLDQQALGSGPSSELLSGLGPSGAERLSAGSRSGGGLLRDLAYEPLWDEPPLIPQHRRTTSPDDFDFMPEAMPQIRRNSRSRRSERREPSPSDQERRRTPKEGIVHRRRSRSQGRHPFSAYHDMPFLGSATHRPLLPTRPESHTGGSIGSVGMGGHVYYSSGGSNSGRSPPPEMPAQSAVPPAGVHKPKGKRAVDLNAAFK